MMFLYKSHITPRYFNLGLLKFRDIVKMYTCLFFYDHLCDNKPRNFLISLVSEQHNRELKSPRFLYESSLMEKRYLAM